MKYENFSSVMENMEAQQLTGLSMCISSTE